MNHSLRALFAGLVLAAVALAAPRGLLSASQDELVLDNGRLRANFSDRGLVSLTSLRSDRRLGFAGDPTSVTVDGRRLAVEELGLPEIEMKPARLTYRYTRDPYTIEVVYDLKAGWGFLSKHIVLTSAGRSAYRLDDVALLGSTLDRPVLDELKLAEGRWGALCRFAGGSGESGAPAWGAFFVVQNPFMDWARSGAKVGASYAPAMEWKPDYGPFTSDRLCVGLYELGGTRFPAKAVPEWKLVPVAGLPAGTPLIDANEVDALTDCVRSFLLYYPGRVRVHIPWTENDYQIDVGTEAGVEEYKRIMDQAAALGASHLLYTPANSLLSSLESNSDAWGWENVLWFGLGQKIRKGEWDPRLDEIPAGLRAMLDYAGSKGLKLMAYVYPSLAFAQNPEWTKWAGTKVGGYAGADTGIRGFQDWLIQTLLAFLRKTGAAGFSFDHWWIAYDGASSKYAQWFGCRRILETLRREAPEIVIDGRQQYQNFGPWTWLAGSYPHPTLTDEQAESFTAFPDLHTDRVSADRQRFAAWTYRVERFAPTEIMPGYITHQSERSDAENVMRRDRFRPKDWDYLGWRYSLLSSIGTAPFNHVLDFIPARDTEEFKALSEDDKAWFRRWLDWAGDNGGFLRALRPIIGPPMIGRVDGTAAIVEDRGYVFLFNPNPGRNEARFKLDASIGLVKGDRFVIRELHPAEGMVIGSAEGFWKAGAEVVLPMGGADARVLEVFPAPAELQEPALFNVPGTLTFRNGQLVITKVSGEPGTTAEALVLLPKGKTVRAMSVNGVMYPFKQNLDLVPFTVRFAGREFGKLQRVGAYDPGFTGGSFKAKFTIPARVFQQLAGRKTAWPVSYTEDDLVATWLGPWRLLLFVAVAEPRDTMDVALAINGRPVEVKKAYNGVYPRNPERTYVGCYADLSGLKPDTPYEIEATLPALLPGQFLGLFFENVEPESTMRLLAPKPLR